MGIEELALYSIPIGQFLSGGVLLSHTLTSAVPSAQEGLASGFGMGPGVSPPPTPPKHYEDNHHTQPETFQSPAMPVGSFRTTQWMRNTFVDKPSAY